MPRQKNALRHQQPKARQAFRSALPPAWLPWVKPAFFAAALVLAWFGQEQLFDRHLTPGLILWLAAAAAAVLAFARQPDRLETPEISPRFEAACLALILVAAAVFRTWRLSAIPHGYFFDEAVNALEGLQMLKDPKALSIFGPSDAPLPALHFYLNTLALKLGGVNVLATKIMIACWGCLTVAVFYFLARRVVSVPVALAAAFLLAVMRWHVNFSRINFVGISTPLFGAAAAYFLFRGLETKNRWHMGLSGLAVALGLYTYYASNLIPLVIGTYLVLQLAWDRKFLQEQWQGVLVFLVVSLAVFAPLGHFALTEPGRFFARNGQVLIFNHVPPEQAWSAFWQNVKLTLLMFNHFGDCNGRHNLPEAPLLDMTTGLLFGLGLIWSVSHFWRKHNFYSAAWFLVALIPGFFTIEAPQGYRCIGAIIPVALLAGIGLERIWQSASELTQGTQARKWLWVGLAILGAYVAAQNWQDYFDRQAGHTACWSEFSCREFAMGERVHELGPTYHAYISAGSFNYPTIRFLGYPYLDAEPLQIISSLPSSFDGGKNIVYMLLPVHDGALELLRYYYPGGQEKVYPSPYDFTLFTEYRVSHAQIRQERGLNGIYRGSDGRELKQQDGQEAFRLEQPAAGLARPVTARWTGSLRVPAWATYRFRMDGAAAFRLAIDGQSVPPSGVQLAQGMHNLSAQAEISASNQPLTWLWQRGEHAPWNPIPGTALSPQAQVHGLTGTYYLTPDRSGNPYLKRVDPLLALLGADFPLSAPFSAAWQGRINLPKTGTYGFGTFSNETSSVTIDGKRVVENKIPDTYQEAQTRLEAGLHRIRIDYEKKAGAYPQMILYWTPPGKNKQKVPFANLLPE